MITKEQAEEMLPEEAAKANISEARDLEVFSILISKTLLHLAAKDEIEMYIGDNGQISFNMRLM